MGALILLAIWMICSISVVTANSGMAWAGASESEYGHGTAVQYSPNGDIIASGHESTLMISDSYTHEKLQMIHVEFFIQSLDFTSDARYLLVGMESSLPDTPATVVFEFINGEYVRTMHTEDGLDVDRISVSHDDATFATATENGNIVEWEMSTGEGTKLNMNREYNSRHTGHITCIDHSNDGQHLLTGAEGGLVILWDRENQTEIGDWQHPAPIVDCGFSNDGEIMSWIGGGSLIMRNHDPTFSYFGQYDISSDASQLSYSSNDHEIAIFTPIYDGTDRRRVDFIGIDTIPFYDSRTLYLGHEAEMISLHPYDNSIAIATLSNLVAYYSDSVPIEMEIPTLIDTDQDNIPDEIDDDDDGDGIVDDFDNICIAGNNCHLQPDQDHIRQFDISINGNDVIIVESIHLNSVDSSHIRQLVATSISSNHRVDSQEFIDFEFTVCDEYNASAMMVKWNSYLEIGGHTFNPISVQCNIDDGLSGTFDDDLGTRIEISWTISGTIQQSVKAPYNVSIVSGIPITSSTIAQNVHSFPIHIEIEDVSGSRVSYEIWNRRDPDLFLQMDIAVDDKTEIDNAVDILLKYWYAFSALGIGTISMIVLLIIRRKNSISFDELDDDGELPDDEWEEMVDDAAAWDEIIDDDRPKKRPTPPAAVMKDLRKKPKPPSAVQKDLSNQRRRTTKKTKASESIEQIPTGEDSDSETVGFMHLVSTDNVTKDSHGDDDDDDISDAIAFITSDSPDKSKRKRPVRRRKSQD